MLPLERNPGSAEPGVTRSKVKTSSGSLRVVGGASIVNTTLWQLDRTR